MLGLVLLSPCVSTGWVADDLLHRLMLNPASGMPALARHPLDLFRFASGDPASTRELVSAGVFPWWAHPDVKLAFFRPLSSLTHWVDHELWPDSAALMHWHSLAWFGLLLASVAGLYLRFCGRRSVVVLAFLLFSVDDAHAPVAGWIANRNALVALCFALPAVLLHDLHRRGQFRLGAWLAPLSLAVGLSGGETALIGCAYLAAYAAFLDEGPLAARCASLLPYAAVVVGWRLVTTGLGYGVQGSGLYVDPVSSPVAFLLAAAERFPVLVLAQLALPWADFWEVFPLVLPAVRVGVYGLALIVLVVLVALVRPLWRAHAHVRFWTAGSALALLPVCATFPHDRLLLGAGVGAMALVAELLVRAFGSSLRRDKVVIGVLGFLHLGVAPLLLPLRASRVGDLTRLLEAADTAIPATDDVMRKGVILLNPPLDPLAAYLPIYRAAALRPRPRYLLWIANGVTELTVSAVDTRTVRVRARDGFLSTSSQWMLRDPGSRDYESGRMDFDGARVEVRSFTADGRPLEIEMRLDEPVQSDHVLWLRWDEHGYAPFVPPAPGNSLVIPPVDVAKALLVQ